MGARRCWLQGCPRPLFHNISSLALLCHVSKGYSFQDGSWVCCCLRQIIVVASACCQAGATARADPGPDPDPGEDAEEACYAAVMAACPPTAAAACFERVARQRECSALQRGPPGDSRASCETCPICRKSPIIDMPRGSASAPRCRAGLPGISAPRANPFQARRKPHMIKSESHNCVDATGCIVGECRCNCTQQGMIDLLVQASSSSGLLGCGPTNFHRHPWSLSVMR